MSRKQEPPPSTAETTAEGWPSEAETSRAIADLAERVRQITSENERLFRQLLSGERRFRGLAQAVWRVQEEERRRLARELHDGLGQTLTALKIQIERLAGRAKNLGPDGSALAGQMSEAVEVAHHALNEARRLSHLLRPQVLDDLGLVPALQWLGRTLEEWTGFKVSFEHTGMGEERLAPDVETLVFRVVQEAVNNALKHSGAEGARIELVRRPKRLSVCVADAGNGFDAAAMLSEYGPSSGSGLRGMRDRVEVFGGRFRIKSSPGAGAELRAELPLDEPEEEGSR